MLDAAHEVIRDAGHAEVFLYTEERNERARSFYAAAGYQPDGTARDSEANGVPTHELRLVKRFGG